MNKVLQIQEKILSELSKVSEEITEIKNHFKLETLDKQLKEIVKLQPLIDKPVEHKFKVGEKVKLKNYTKEKYLPSGSIGEVIEVSAYWYSGNTYQSAYVDFNINFPRVYLEEKYIDSVESLLQDN